MLALTRDWSNLASDLLERSMVIFFCLFFSFPFYFRRYLYKKMETAWRGTDCLVFHFLSIFIFSSPLDQRRRRRLDLDVVFYSRPLLFFADQSGRKSYITLDHFSSFSGRRSCWPSLRIVPSTYFFKEGKSNGGLLLF